MKRKHTIRVKDSKLRRIRDQFRVLLLEVLKAKSIKISNRTIELQKSEGFWNEKSSDYKTLNRKAQELSSQKNDLDYAFHNSIVFCPVCRKINKDMTYNPVSRVWFCVECYKFNQMFETEQGRPELYP